MEPTPDAAFLPLRLRPDERRDLAKRLAERLGTHTAGGMSLFANEAADAPEGLRRLVLDGTAGDVKVRGVQEFGGGRQRDTVAIGGLEGGLGVVLSVDEAALVEDAPGRVRVEARGGPDAAARLAAIEEAFRLAGERFSALFLKKQVAVRAVPLPPLEPDDLARWLRGRWKPVPAPIRDAKHLDAPHLDRLALIEDPKRSGRHLLVREVPDAAPERAVAPLAVVPAGGAIGGFELGAGFDARRLDKALATLLWDTLQQTATDPRPTPEPFATAAPGTLHTAAFVLASVRTASGLARPAGHGHGPRLAVADLSVTGTGGASRGEVAERQLYGLQGEGFAIIASSRNEGRTAGLLAGPAAAVAKWIAKLESALK